MSASTIQSLRITPPSIRGSCIRVSCGSNRKDPPNGFLHAGPANRTFRIADHEYICCNAAELGQWHDGTMSHEIVNSILQKCIPTMPRVSFFPRVQAGLAWHDAVARPSKGSGLQSPPRAGYSSDRAHSDAAP